jgi:hypothetical protein
MDPIARTSAEQGMFLTVGKCSIYSFRSLMTARSMPLVPDLLLTTIARACFTRCLKSVPT